MRGEKMTTQPEINEFENVETPWHSEGFEVTDDQKADWAIRKLASVRRKQAENKKIYDAEVIRLTEWLALVNHALEKDGAYFEAILTPYALVQRWEGRKTVSLPHGTIKTTAGQPKIEFESEDRFIEWALVNDPDLLKIKTDIDKSAVKALITDEGVVISTQGEIVPEVKVIPAEISVKFATE
jgi:hypothetical protein